MKKLYIFNEGDNQQLLNLTDCYLKQIKKNYFSKDNELVLQDSKKDLIQFIKVNQLDYWDDFDLSELEQYIDEYPEIEGALIEIILDETSLKSLLNMLNEISNEKYESLKRFIRYNLKQENVIVYSSYLSI